ncbi:hypothetical protein CEXT_609581 [Caerostris extrusa]|uniref:Uncharacterized protein n=1 Tax=Caerostris extrusa TaxID=172846 RepID=A0AAV4XW80_CAEEX|nr:hypothetical protein CEXT_609581 [Caerostris extrusa]
MTETSESGAQQTARANTIPNKIVHGVNIGFKQMDHLFSANLPGYQQINKKLQSRNLNFCGFRSLPTVQKLFGLLNRTTWLQRRMWRFSSTKWCYRARINIATIETPSHIDFRKWQITKRVTKNYRKFLVHPDKSSLVLQPFPIGKFSLLSYMCRQFFQVVRGLSTGGYVYQQVPLHRLSIQDWFRGSVLHFELQQIRAPNSKPDCLKLLTKFLGTARH